MTRVGDHEWAVSLICTVEPMERHTHGWVGRLLVSVLSSAKVRVLVSRYGKWADGYSVEWEGIMIFRG